ncbi:hypothetical protein P4T86_22430 [Bacillus licheniformis]|uniref:hypothetical protein n=1 Tax=Bacillus licheniformis TaxID=1402 RepID=UPI002E235CCF|nr:hypothetical protein [Bacillus licheniformis]
MTTKNSLYKELIEYKKVNQYARSLTNKYRTGKFDDNFRYYKSMLVSHIFTNAESFMRNRLVTPSECLEVLHNPKHKMHKNMVNYIYLNAFHLAEDEIATENGKVRTGRGKNRSWEDNPIHYNSEALSDQSEPLEAHYAPTDNKKKEALEIASKYFRADTAAFIKDVFEMSEEEVKEKYDYETKDLNRRISNIEKQADRIRPRYDHLLSTEYEEQLKESLETVEKLIECASLDDAAFMESIYDHKDVEPVSTIISDVVPSDEVSTFLTDCQNAFLNPNIYEVLNALHTQERILQESLQQERNKAKRSPWPIDLKRYAHNKKIHDTYNSFIEEQPCYCYDKDGNLMYILYHNRVITDAESM